MFGYFGGTVTYNTFYNCSGVGLSVAAYSWTIENNNIVCNAESFRIIGPFEPEPSDVWQQELLKNFNMTLVENVSVANNYWGTADESKLKELLQHPKYIIEYKPFKTSFINEALPY